MGKTKHSMNIKASQVDDVECLDCGEKVQWEPLDGSGKMFAWCCTGEYHLTPSSYACRIETGLYDVEDEMELLRAAALDHRGTP